MAQRAMKEMKMKKRVALELRFFAIAGGVEAPELVFFSRSVIHIHTEKNILLLTFLFFGYNYNLQTLIYFYIKNCFILILM
jgi:hypothetical protein